MILFDISGAGISMFQKADKGRRLSVAAVQSACRLVKTEGTIDIDNRHKNRRLPRLMWPFGCVRYWIDRYPYQVQTIVHSIAERRNPANSAVFSYGCQTACTANPIGTSFCCKLAFCRYA